MKHWQTIPIQLCKRSQTMGKRASQRSQSNFPLLPPDVRATEQGARFRPTDHRDTASDDTRRDPSHAPLGWKFCTMNMTAFSTQHLAIFELECHVCGLQETHLTEAGQVWAREVIERTKLEHRFWQPLEALRSAWEATPGGVATAAGPGVELQRVPHVSAQERALHDMGRHVRALVAYGKGDQVVHVVSLHGHAGAGDIPFNITPHFSGLALSH